MSQGSLNEHLDGTELRPWKRTALAACGSRALSHEWEGEEREGRGDTQSSVQRY